MVRGLTHSPIRLEDTDTRLDEIERLMLKGLVHSAYMAATAIGKLSDMKGPRAQCTAAWIADHVGADELARRWYLKASREFPRHASTKYYTTSLTLRERGPVEAWLMLRNFEVPPDTSALDRAELQGLRASILAYLQDHSEAQRELDAVDAEVLGYDRKAAIQIVLLEQRNQVAEAFEHAMAFLTVSEPCRLLVQEAVSLLETRNRRAEALELIQRYEPRMESASVTLHRAGIEHELGLFPEELRSLDRCERLWCMPGPAACRSLRIRRAENAYRQGQMSQFRALARGSAVAWYENCVETTAEHEGPPDRHLIDVPIVIQEPMGCAPSSLAILSAYFGSPVDHVDVADQICYEGTASHSERRWVQSRGWLSREFTVDFATVKALIGRGIPFLLVTVAVGSAHAQVVVGFDATRRTIMLRDPNTYRVLEADADLLFRRHRAYGPRGHVMLPLERAYLLDDLALPDVALHDIAFRMQLALERHDRDGALAELGQLIREAPVHPLTLWAERSLAIDNQDPYAIMACSERVLRAFPGDDNAELSILDCLGTIGTETEVVDRIESRLALHNPDSTGSFAFQERRAQLLLADARQHARARRLLRRAHRQQATRGRTIAMLAQVLPARDPSKTATCLLRAASTLNPTDDDLAWLYFEHCYKDNAPGPALEWLKDRFERYSARSSQPALLLFRAYEWLERADEAFGVLEQAEQIRPGDEALQLFAAEAHARYGHSSKATAQIEVARERAKPAAVEQVAALLAELAGNLSEALDRHRGVLQSTPLSLRSHEAVASLLFELQGPASARAHFAESCRKFPTHVGLKELHVAWLRGHDPSVVLAELDLLLSMQPNHHWARRERALALMDLGRLDDALAAAQNACELAPLQGAGHSTYSLVLAAAGQREAALREARTAAEIWPDGYDAIGACVRLASSREQQLQLLEWAEHLAIERTADGCAIIEWYQQALGVLSDVELQEKCNNVSLSRPELWVGYHVQGLQSLRLGHADHAIKVLEAGVHRFPFIPRLGIDLADAHAAAGDRARELQVAEAALRQSPRWLEAILRVSDAHLHREDESAGMATLARGLMYHPRSAPLLRARAAIQWSMGAVELAFEDLRQAVAVAPSDSQSWQLFDSYARTLERSFEVVTYARGLAAQRPHNPYIWLRLAEILRLESENQACLAALNEALRRDPQLTDALDLAAVTLTSIGRDSEALAMCERPVAAYFSRGALRARRAWVIRQSGNLQGAIEAARELLKDHPDNSWARARLIEWEIQAGHTTEAVEAAKSLVDADPLSASSHVYLGIARQEAGEQDLAFLAYGKAADIDRSSVFAGRRQIEIAIAQGRLDEATRVLDYQGSQVPPHDRDFWTLLVQLARHESELAWESFERLAMRTTTPLELLAQAARSLSQLEARLLLEGFGHLLEREGARYELGYYWVLALDEVSRRPSIWDILALGRLQPKAAACAAKAYFELLGDERPPWWRAAWAVWCLRRIAKPHDDAWGKAGYALAASRAYLAGQWWLRDYAARGSIQAWMLHNYRVCALENHQYEAAARAVHHALTLPTDDTLRPHLAFAAFERATAGDVGAARELLAGRSVTDASGKELWLLNATTALIEIANQGRGRQSEILQNMEHELGLTTVGAFGWFTEGILHRTLAAGVLKQVWSLRYFLWRHALVFPLAVISWLVLSAGEPTSSASRIAVFLLVVYLLRRQGR